MVKKSTKQNLKSEDSTYEERLMVLVENLGDEIKLVAEGNLMTREIMERGFADVNKRFDIMENRMDSLENRMDSIENKINFLEKDMRSSYKTIIEYMSRIESELSEIKVELRRLNEKKADKETLLIFEKRIIKVEMELEECKNVCKNR